MTDLEQVLRAFIEVGNYTETHEGLALDFVSKMDEDVDTVEASFLEIGAEWTDALDLWRICKSADLLSEPDERSPVYGLHLNSPLEALIWTRVGQRDFGFAADDLVLGRFNGEAVYLLLAPSESGSRRILVVDPIDRRPQWAPGGRTLADFLWGYLAARGERFWEASP